LASERAVRIGRDDTRGAGGRYPSTVMTRPSEQAINEALSRVQDPELRRSLTELGMVKNVEISDAGHVAVLIALTVPGCPLKAKIENDVTAELRRVEGVTGASIAFTHMSDEERGALSARLRGPAKEQKTLAIPNRTRVIAVGSGKGGVGKSSLTVNLAVALAQQGHEVGIVDADIYGFSIPGMMGIAQRPVTMDGMILPPVGWDVKTMSIGYFLEEEGAVMWRGPMLHRALEQFMQDVHWGEIDYLLVDMPPGTGDIAISLGQLLPTAEAIIVTTPNPAAQRVAERAAAVAHRMKMSITGVVENMSYRICPCCGERDDVFGSGGGAGLADKIGAPLLAQIPLEPALRSGGDAGTPVVAADPESPAATAIVELARTLARSRNADPAQRMTKRLTVL
jgi:ATP-binding protein involved in chromosome partitioning